MDRDMPRQWRAGDNSHRKAARRGRSPDRLALWAVVLAVFSLVVAAASARGSSGGISSEGGTPSDPVAGTVPSEEAAPFGSRILRVGMEGDDVKVLNGIVRSKRYASTVRLSTVFEAPTKQAVKEFQDQAGLPATGVVSEETSAALAHSMDRAGATWYGPGFYGQRTACGQVLRRTTIGVAHRSLRCGTKVTLAYHGHYVVAPVIDRGPYASGYAFDLTGATAAALGVTTSTQLRYALAKPGSDRRGL